MDNRERIEKLSAERVENLKQALADAIVAVEANNEQMKWSCEQMQWDSEVCYLIEEGILKFGCALASLHKWYEE